MTDIVEWLRGVAESRTRAFGEAGLLGDRHEEAADEIGRLRAIVEGDDIGSVKRAYADGYAAAQHEIKRLEDALRDAKAEIDELRTYWGQ